MKAAEIRRVRGEFAPVLRRIVEDVLPSEFVFGVPPSGWVGQYWDWELSIWDSARNHSVDCGRFYSLGTYSNSPVSINEFFANNDRLLDEVLHAMEEAELDDLIPPFRLLDDLVGDARHADLSNGGALTIRAATNAPDEWVRSVCDEVVLILHLDEDGHGTLDGDCMQSERHQIRVPSTSGFTYMSVPFDKVAAFAGSERVEGYRRLPYKDYEVALSFAGEDRAYVEQVAKALRTAGVRVFYDRYEEVGLWGKDLYVHLDEVYRKKARFCVVFLSTHYRDKLWTNHERSSAQARAFEEHSEYILPVKLDDTEIPGIRKTTGYVEKVKPAKLARLIREKVSGL